ncbi:MAG: TldD/PmbA family protein [Euryarchaeota archaeon]|nr:TldD/PmbA family protein [Euryarchaeota archaeon]MDE2046599.1 TldD/PmbA family protein [Thermoplasmata archaeon]
MSPRSSARPTASRAGTASVGAPKGGTGPRPELRRGFEVLDQLLSLVKGQADARFYEDRWVTLRCANSRLYQPHAESVASLSLRVAVEGGQLGVATTTDLTSQGLKRVAEEATSLARVAPPVRGFPGFPSDPGGPTAEVPFAPRAEREDLEGLGDQLAGAFAIIEEGLGPSRISGVYNQGTSVVAVANTSGLRRGYRRSAAQASLLAEQPQKDPPVSGWSEGTHWDPEKVDLLSLAKEAVAATPRTAPRPAKPGKYRVLLMGPAVSELTGHLTWLGLGANAVEEGWSFLVKGQGKRLVAPAFELSDDPFSPHGVPAAVDYEGLPHRSRPIFRQGKAEGPAHDSITGARAERESTRNALPPEAPYGELGPLPLHLTMRAGDRSRDELVKDLKQGILVTRFWYVRSVHPGKTIITGMTRDGTYWVDKGEVQHPIRNLRFTESILRTLAGVESVGERLRGYGDERAFSAHVLAPIVSRSFTFTSATTF